jgi:hypothetical protein
VPHAPIFKVNLRAVFHCNRVHVLFSYSYFGVGDPFSRLAAIPPTSRTEYALLNGPPQPRRLDERVKIADAFIFKLFLADSR